MNKQYNFIFPHENGNKLYNSKELFQSKKCVLLINEVTCQATGMGIEMGWANLLNIPIVCAYKKGSKVSNSLRAVTNEFIEYTDSNDLISKLKNYLK